MARGLWAIVAGHKRYFDRLFEMTFATKAIVASLVAVAASGCSPAPMGGRALKVAERLDCPAAQGDLTRTEVAADGRRCGYRGASGERATLQLLATDGRSPQTALAPLEAELKRDVPVDGGSAPASPHAEADHDNARVDLPGLDIDAHGDRAKVKVAGVDIDADGDRADVNVTGGFGKIASVKADDHGAEMHSGQVSVANAELLFTLAAMAAGPTGDHAAGYVARGPRSGPLVVGVFRSPAGGSGGDAFKDIKRLVNRNVGR